MAFRREFDLDMEKVAAYLKDVVSKVEANPEYYEELRKVFKKNVPLTRRSWVAAFLIKNAAGAINHFNPNHGKREDFRSRRDNREESRRNRYESNSDSTKETDNTEKHERAPRAAIPEELAATVFVGVGKNRRVFPRDIVGMFTNVAGIEREKIGDIRVLANYSFVTLYKEDAEKVISALNEYEYRGRKLSVSYSRQKDESAEAVETSESADSEVFTERVPDVENTTAPHVDSYTTTTTDTMAQQAAFAAAQAEMTDEEILAARAPRSSSTADIQ